MSVLRLVNCLGRWRSSDERIFFHCLTGSPRSYPVCRDRTVRCENLGYGDITFIRPSFVKSWARSRGCSRRRPAQPPSSPKPAAPTMRLARRCPPPVASPFDRTVSPPTVLLTLGVANVQDAAANGSAPWAVVRQPQRGSYRQCRRRCVRPAGLPLVSRTPIFAVLACGVSTWVSLTQGWLLSIFRVVRVLPGGTTLGTFPSFTSCTPSHSLLPTPSRARDAIGAGFG